MAYGKHQDKEDKPILVADVGLWYALAKPWNANFLQEFPRNLQLLLVELEHGEKPVGIKVMQVPGMGGHGSIIVIPLPWISMQASITSVSLFVVSLLSCTGMENGIQ